ncbi:MAG: transporter substrate-binding domain-containing protein, partial [Chlamydiota bacterium]|nr:transporter substrate-binding domain-containing protein [Chlamydiota bacterium]
MPKKKHHCVISSYSHQTVKRAHRQEKHTESITSLFFSPLSSSPFFFSMIKRLTSLLFYVLTIVSAGCSPSNTTYHIGINLYWPHVHTEGKEAPLMGFFHDFSAAMAEELSTPIEITILEEESLHTLESGKTDALISSLYPYQFYQEQYRFSPLIIPTGSLIIFQEGTHPFNLPNIVVTNEEDALFFRRYHPNLLVEKVTSAREALYALKEGYTEAVVIDALLAHSLLKEMGLDEKKTVLLPLRDQGIRMISKRESKRITPLIRALQALEEDGRLDVL